MGFGYFMYSHSLVPVIDPKGGSGHDNDMLLLQKQLMRMNNPFRTRFLFLHLNVGVEVEVEVEAEVGLE